jgi:hypothetical protein
MDGDTLIFSTTAMGDLHVQRSAVAKLEVNGVEQPVLSAVIAPVASVPAPPQPPTALPQSVWRVSASTAPATVILGTESQEQFGGRLSTWHPFSGELLGIGLEASGSHTRVYKEKNPGIETDTTDDYLEANFRTPRSSNQLQPRLDFFTNNSLGMAMRKEAGADYLFNDRAWNNGLSAGASIGGYYVNEHLDHTAAALNLAGIRLQEHLQFRSRYIKSLDEQAWTVLTPNNIHALYGFARLGVSWPVSKRLSVGLSEEECYVDNPPSPNRRNYLSNSVSLTFENPPKPTQP